MGFYYTGTILMRDIWRAPGSFSYNLQPQPGWRLMIFRIWDFHGLHVHFGIKINWQLVSWIGASNQFVWSKVCELSSSCSLFVERTQGNHPPVPFSASCSRLFLFTTTSFHRPRVSLFPGKWGGQSKKLSLKFFFFFYIFVGYPPCN